MSKSEIKTKTLNIIENLWWKFVPGTTVRVKWPVGEVVIDESMQKWDWTIGPSRYIIESSDPNDHYRPWLEKNVGKQGWDWNWRIGPVAATNTDGSVAGFDSLLIKFRKSKAELATIAAIKWS